MSDEIDWNEIDFENNDVDLESGGSCTEDDDEVVEWRNEIALLRKHNDAEFILNDDENDEIESPGVLKEPPDLTQILESAKDGLTPSISNVLVLNHSVVVILNNLLRSVKMRLKRNQEEQEELVKYLEFVKKNSSLNKKSFPSFKSCGMPFFQRSFVAPPVNAYIRQMSAKNYIFASELITPASSWMSGELKELRNHVINSVREGALDKLQYRVACARSGQGSKTLAMTALEMKKLDVESQIIHASQVDWLRVAANLKTQSNFSADECEAAWTYIVGNHINISKWSRDEKLRLFALAEKYCFQNWDTIAAKLASGRSAWQCCIHFQRRLMFEPYPWDPAEDKKLKDLIAQHSKGDYIPWFKIYYYFSNRTGRQIRERYIYRLRPSKKGRFSIVEDEAIMSVAEAYNGDMQILKKYFPDRALPSVYSRYRSLMRDKSAFTGAEDQALIEAVAAHGTDWSVVAQALHGRQAKEVSRRYSRLLEFTHDFLGGVRKKEGNRLVKSLPVRSEAAVMAVMQLMWKPDLNKKNPCSYSLYGLSLAQDASIPMKELLRLLEFGDKHLFGPKLATPRSSEERKAMAARLAYLSSVLSVPCDFSNISIRLENLPTFGHPEEVILSLRELPTITFSSICAQCWVPPSALTLLGLRVIFSARSYLLAEASLCNRDVKTWRDPNIPKEDRLNATNAKSRLRSRMVHIFFLTACISKITRHAVVTQPKVKKPKAKTILRSKKHCKMMAKARWKSKSSKKVPEKVEEKISVPKKARMIRVTPASNSTTNVQLIDGSKYNVSSIEAPVLDEPVTKKRKGRPRKKPQ